MNQAPADPHIASNPSTTPGPAVLRQPNSVLYELALLTAGVVGLVTLRDSGWGVQPFAALIILSVLWAVAFARWEIRVQDGRLTFRDQFRPSRSVDLSQLISVRAPAKRERWLTGRKFMVLTDRKGAEVRLTLFGTRPSQRSRVLAPLEPYVMADGVSREGLVDEALSGELWWPRPRT